MSPANSSLRCANGSGAFLFLAPRAMASCSFRTSSSARRCASSAARKRLDALSVSALSSKSVLSGEGSGGAATGGGAAERTAIGFEAGSIIMSGDPSMDEDVWAILELAAGGATSFLRHNVTISWNKNRNQHMLPHSPLQTSMILRRRSRQRVQTIRSKRPVESRCRGGCRTA